MIKKESIEEQALRLLTPITDEKQFEVVDVEYVKEGSDYILRAYIDKPGGIRIDDCETVSRALEAELDRTDLIPEAYILEVSSPGLLRPLKKDRDYERNLGKALELHLFKAQDGEKDYVGKLTAFDAESCSLEFEDGTARCFSRRDISLIRPYIDFSDL